MWIPIHDVGKYGVILDRPAHEIPPNAWTRARNVRGLNNFIERAGGETEVYTTGTIVDAPLNLFYCPAVDGQPFWVYAGYQRVAAVNNDGHYDISPAYVFNADESKPWTGSWLNGVFVLNNVADEPHVWDNIDPLGGGNVLKAMSAIPNTEFQSSWKFRSMRVFKDILIGMNFKDGAGDFPTTVKWSGPALSGTVPLEWDKDNPNNIANEKPLSATPGECVDGVQVGDRFIVFKEDATVTATLTQGASALGFKYISQTIGMMTTHCAVEFKPGYCVYLTQTADLVVTDGLTTTSILDNIVRTYLQTAINVEKLARCFLAINPYQKEVWVCYPKSSDDWATEALVWNFKDNTFTFKDLGNIAHINFGKSDDGEVIPFIDDVDVIIDLANYPIDGGGLGGRYTIQGCSHSRNKIYEMEVGTQINDADYTCTLERKGIALVGQARDGSPRVDHQKVKVCAGIWPVVETSGGPVTLQISVGAQERRDGPIVWDGPYDYDPDTDQALDVIIEGVYLAVRITSQSSEVWKLHGFSLDINIVGDKL